MKVVSKRDDIVDNLIILEGYLHSDNEKERNFAIDLLKNAVRLVAYKVNGENHFAPADFVVYKGNSMDDYEVPEDEGKAIASILTKVVGLPFSNEKTEEKFMDYASQFGKSFPEKNRSYWRLKDERRKNLNLSL